MLTLPAPRPGPDNPSASGPSRTACPGPDRTARQPAPVPLCPVPAPAGSPDRTVSGRPVPSRLRPARVRRPVAPPSAVGDRRRWRHHHSSAAWRAPPPRLPSRPTLSSTPSRHMCATSSSSAPSTASSLPASAPSRSNC